MKKIITLMFAIMLAITVLPLVKADTISSSAAYNSVNVTANDSFAVGVVIKDWEQDTSTVTSGSTYTQFHTNFSVVLPAASCINNVEFHMPDLGFNETSGTTAQAVTNITLYNTTYNNIGPSYAIWTGRLNASSTTNNEGYPIINFTNWTTTDAAVYESQVCSTGGAAWNGTIVYYSEPIWVTRYNYDSVSGDSVSQFFNVTTNHTKNNINFTGVTLSQLQPDKWYQRISGNTTVFYDTWGNSTQYSGSNHLTVATGSAGYLTVSGVDARGSLNNVSVSFTRTASSDSDGSSASGGASDTAITPGTAVGLTPISIALYLVGIVLLVGAVIVIAYLYNAGKL